MKKEIKFFNMQKNKKENWVNELGSRSTLDQKMGGYFFDYIDVRKVRLSNDRYKHLLSCIREETRMSDITLKKVFKGETNNLDFVLRFMGGVHEVLKKNEAHEFWENLGELLDKFFTEHGEEYLEEECARYRPKHHNSEQGGKKKKKKNNHSQSIH